MISTTARALVLTLAFATTLSAQVPQLLNYQGRVAVGTVNFEGAGQFKFALVNGDASTTYWSNDGTSGTGSEPASAVTLAVTKGLYSVLLGDTTLANMMAIPPGVFSNPDVHLRVWFDDGVNGSQLLTPDQRIAAVGYAMVANTLTPNPTITGTVTATAFSGDGSGLTNIPSTSIAAPPPGMALIPAGTFVMGNSVAADTDITDADPVATTVSAFYIDVTEVTLSQWQAVYLWALDQGYSFVNAGAGKAANHPVHSVNWYDCVKWCNARSEQMGKTPVYYSDAGLTTVYRSGEVEVFVNWAAVGYRLPTEAEWEKAARGGLSGQRFPWGAQISQNLANYTGETATFTYDLGPDGLNPIGSVGGTSPATTPVGTFAANGYGLYDMAGNLFEWCWDRKETPLPGGTDPHGAETGTDRVFRGGRWAGLARVCRVAGRYRQAPDIANLSNGFRTVLPPSQ